MKKFKVTINGKTFEVEVEEMGTATSETPATPVKEEKVAEPVAAKPKAVPGDVEGEEILAPLPGTISLEVKEGDNVSEGDIIFILEAMKMENEITATASGTVKEIYVSNGDSVETGDVLAVIG